MVKYKDFTATITKKVKIRKTASSKGKFIKTGAVGKKYTITKTDGHWWYAPSVKGWFYAKGRAKTHQTATQVKKNKARAKNEARLKKEAKLAKAAGKANGTAFFSQLVTNQKIQNQFDSKIMDQSTRLFGIPHQFMSSADMRFAKDLHLGRAYTENIICEAPIVNIAPGRANYMPGMSAAERKGFMDGIKQFKGASSRGVTDAIKAVGGNRDQRYFNFYGDYTGYMQYVNLMCRSAAIYMDLGKKYPYTHSFKKEKKRYQNYDWSTYRYQKKDEKGTSSKLVITKGDTIFEKGKKLVQQGLNEVMSTVKDTFKTINENVQFFIDPSSSFQETMSNTVGPSMVESTLSSVDEMSKEIGFMTNSLAAGWSAGLTGQIGNGLDKMFGNFSPNNVFKRVFSTASTVVLKGNNMIFPSIYKSSDYSKSYNVTIRLTTPYGSKESIYLNLIVPLMHLVTLVLPRQDTANSYTLPFLVRVSSKGIFSCEMGIIDNMTIEKVMSSMTIHGLPTEIVVQFSVRDLYSNMMVTPSTAPILFFENETLRDWLVVTCGLDASKPYMVEKYTAILTMLLNIAYDAPQTFINWVVDGFKNKINQLGIIR